MSDFEHTYVCRECGHRVTTPGILRKHLWEQRLRGEEGKILEVTESVRCDCSGAEMWLIPPVRRE